MIGQGVYCGLRTASEVFLIFTTQLYSCLRNCDAIFSYIDSREVLQQEHSQSPILPSPHLRWVVNHASLSPYSLSLNYKYNFNKFPFTITSTLFFSIVFVSQFVFITHSNFSRQTPRPGSHSLFSLSSRYLTLHLSSHSPPFVSVPPGGLNSISGSR